MADLILRAQTLIDGTGADPVRDVQVAIRDGRIHAVGTAAAAPDGARVVDYGDATIMPGLIDAHVHLQFTAADEQAVVRTTHKRASDGERITTAIGNAQRALATGVTTLRDTGGYLTLNMLVRDGINAGHVVGPRPVGMRRANHHHRRASELVRSARGLRGRDPTRAAAHD